MDALKISNSGDQIDTKTRRRHRHKAKTTSNLSERLNPDFDPKNAVVQIPSTPKPMPHIEEKTVQDVDSLVKSYPKIIHDYLLKIFQFLQSNKTELCFPNIAPFKQDFLVKIVQDHTILNVLKFWDEGSVQTAKQILDFMGRNKDVFKWIYYMYEDRKLNENVLVYKKVSITKSHSKQDRILWSTAPSTIELGLKNISLTQDLPEMPPGFKITTLNTILRFIKDPTRLILEYPELTPPQAQYMQNLIHSSNQKDGDLGFGFKSMYSVLHLTMENLKDKYEFHVSYKNILDNNKTLIFHKIPKADAERRKVNKNSLNNLNSSISSTSSSESNSLSRSQREYLSKQRIVKKLSETFIQRTLGEFLDFIDDKMMASLEFKSVNVMESRFLESLITMSRSEDFYCLFSSECEVMLKRISRAMKRKDWSLLLNVGKLCRRTEARTIVFYKSPSFESKTVNQIKPVMQSQKADANRVVKMAEALNITVKNEDYTDRQNDAKLTSTSESKNVPSTTESQGNRKKIAFLDAGSLIKVHSNDDNANVTFGKTGPEVTRDQNGPDVTQGQSDPGNTRNGSNAPASRKARLLQALTTPLECNRAERMMRIMGWEGGALGARGEGITEPILPAIHISPGAGLGHVKQAAHRSAAESRIMLLRNLLAFLKSSAAETVVTFAPPVTKRECSFLKHTMPVFNDRKAIGLNGVEEMDLVNNITEEMLADLHLHIDYKISKDKKKLHFIKTMDPKFTLKMSKKKKKLKSKKASKAHDVTTNDDVIDISNTTKDIESICPTRKAAQTLAYKIAFLEKIKEFLTDQREAAEYKFDCVINTKLGTYFQNVIKDINRNATTTRFSEIENDLFGEIRRNSNGCYMSVTFNTEQKFTLQKKFPKKVNSTHSLPPPKSKDLKNTVIYKNNVAIPADKYGINIIDDDHRTIHDNDFVKDGIGTTNKRDTDDDLQMGNSKKEQFNTDEALFDKTTNDEVYEEFDTSKDICLDISNDSLMLDVLEEENRNIDKKYIVMDTEYKNIEHDLNEVNNNQDFKDKNDFGLSRECNVEKNKNNDFVFKSITPANKEPTPKNCEVIKYVSMVSKDDKTINIDLVKLVQETITDVIETTDNDIRDEKVLPLLRCHGVSNGELIYSCHSEYSYNWLKNIIECFAPEVNINDTNFCVKDFKLHMRINSYLKEDVSIAFKSMKMFYPEIDTKKWIVLNEIKNENFVQYALSVDENSFKFISDHGFALFVGIDKAKFSILWN